MVSDLVSLIERVQNSPRLVEQMIVRKLQRKPHLPARRVPTNIIVLDDVSPRYMKAGAALQACHVNLDIAPALPAAGDDPCAASLPALSVRRTAHQARRRNRP